MSIGVIKMFNQAYGISTFSSTAPVTMACIIEGNNIVQIDAYGNKRVIGVTQSAYDELEKISTEYYNKLVEVGIIEVQKTPEQLQQEQVQMMSELMEQMKQVKAEMEVLKNAKSTNAGPNVQNEPTGQQQTNDGLAAGTVNSRQYNKPKSGS